jgi:phosphoglycolate phosphatase
VSRAVLARPYRAYLFDLDGTLVDSAPDICAALNAALDSIGMAPVEERLTRHWVGHGGRVLIEQALAHHGAAARIANDTEMARLLGVFVDYYGAHIADHSRLYPGVADALAGLAARGARLAVVTNKLAGLSLQVLDAFDLRRHFGAVVGGDTLPQRKPDPAPARHALRLLGVEAGDALFVGDSITDVDTARAAGCRVVCVRDGYNHGTPADALGADAVLEHFGELLQSAS